MTTNFVGINSEKAYIFIPSRFEIPREPLAFTKIAFAEGLYELSWKPPISNSEIVNYTIFWCDNERDRPYQCTGFLDWVHVSPATTIYNMTVPDPHKVYQFAISANHKYASSGMVWASCTVIHNKLVGKMKSVWINRIGSDYIEVGWKLDCSDRIGVVEGFNIYYCPIISPYNLNCKGPKLNTTIRADPHTIHGTVIDLKPYTTYMISVAVLTKNGEGVRSDSLYNTTLEAAPTTPRNVLITDTTNSTMVVTWDPPTAMNGVLRYYEVHYSGNVQQVEESTRAQLRDLLAFKNYSVHVTACTVSCSPPSPVVKRQTGIGVPGKINRVPAVRFINSSQVAVVWSRPTNPGGKLDYYQVTSSDGVIQNSTESTAKLPIPDCNTAGRYVKHTFNVRAVNVAPGGQHLYGPWSDAGEGNCFSDGPSSSILVIIWVIGSIGGVAFMLCLMYTSKRMWLKCKVMQDVEVKLPPGLAGEKLLKAGEQHIRQSSADSTNDCSSGQESVTSSLTSDSHVSTDSGTEFDPVASPKLIESPTTWESSSLRQRNVSTMKPNSVAEGTKWESYSKVTKDTEDNLSLARSTPNLTDSSGFRMPQHTWSSTGYISMPSSEELSTSSSPVPKQPTLPSYSVVGVIAKPNVNSYSNITSNMIRADAKPAPPYVSLASLAPMPRDKKPITGIKNLEALTKLIDPPAHNTETPYVQTGLMDPGKSKFGDTIMSISGEFSNRTPYVAVGALTGDVKDKGDEGQSAIDPNSKYDLAASVFHMLKQQEGDDINPEDCESDDYGMFWEEDAKLNRRSEPEVKSSGYVTVTDVKAKTDQQVGKIKGKTPAEEQYSKITVAPNMMQ